MFLKKSWPNCDTLLNVNSKVDFEGNSMVGGRGQKKALTHSVSGLKNEIIVKLKKRNDVIFSFCSAQVYLRDSQMGQRASEN